MRGLRTGCCFLAIALLIGLGPAVLASPAELVEGDEPLAEAGLDQTVQRNTTVYLDAGGSQAPDGDIVSYEWKIERPDGTTTIPECGGCERTSFRPLAVGEYRVNLTVTDGEKRTATDTMYVTVIEAEPPDVSLSGPEYVAVGDEPTLRMDASAGDAALSSVTWFVDGEQDAATFLDGETATETLDIEATEEGTLTASVLVTDRNGTTARASHQVKALDNSEFDVELTGVAEEYEAGDSIEPTVTVTNVGPIADSQEITLEDIDGTAVDSERIALDPGESATINGGYGTPTLTWHTDAGDVGTGAVTACSETHCDSDTTEIVATPEFRIDSLSVDDAAPLEVEASIVNVGETAGTQDVEYCVTCGDDPDVDDNYAGYLEMESSLTLDSGESETVSATWGGDWEDLDGTFDIYVRTDNDTEAITADAGLKYPKVYPHHDVDFVAPNEVEAGKHIKISVSDVNSVTVWPDGGPEEIPDMTPDTIAGSDYLNLGSRHEHGYGDYVPSSPDAYEVTGHPPDRSQMTRTASSGTIISMPTHDDQIGKSITMCVNDATASHPYPGSDYGSCESVDVISGDDGGDNPEQ